MTRERCVIGQPLEQAPFFFQTDVKGAIELPQDLPTVTYYGHTDVGNVRTNNEDVFYVNLSPADGVLIE